MSNNWQIKKSPVTGARWIETADGETVCDLYCHSNHSPTGVLIYPAASEHAQAIIAAADPTITQELVAAVGALMDELQLELGLDENGNDADGGQYLSYNQGIEALNRLRGSV